MISETAKKILKEGKIRVKVKRAGMLQFQVFEVKRIKIGDSYFAELFVGRLINLDELIRIANECGLPVEAENGRAFPKGKGANDFIGL